MKRKLKGTSAQPAQVPAHASAVATSRLSTTAAHSNIALFDELPDEDNSAATLLTFDGCDVFSESSPAAFVDRVRRESFDLLVINWRNKSKLGMDVLNQVRETTRVGSWVPVFVLTTRTSEFDVVRALEAGADECMPQPWRPFELVARANALLRIPREANNQSVETLYGFGFNSATRLVQGNGVRAKLSPLEFDLAQLLLRNFGAPLSRPYLFETLWGGEGSPRTVDQHIGRLRRKLALVPENGFVLQGIYGTGYVVQPATARPLAGSLHQDRVQS